MVHRDALLHRHRSVPSLQVPTCRQFATQRTDRQDTFRRGDDGDLVPEDSEGVMAGGAWWAPRTHEVEGPDLHPHPLYGEAGLVGSRDEVIDLPWLLSQEGA
jgi:hypothetical protein